jgi:hypothetical protein
MLPVINNNGVIYFFHFLVHFCKVKVAPPLSRNDSNTPRVELAIRD